MMKVGIVGMPNAGKSSLFNALSQAGAQAANYPFTTIEPNVAVVGRGGRAPRRGRARRSAPSNIVPDTIEFHDIAGLVAGAHKGEGLGNQFLANIRETDALLHVVRAHDDPNVIHPDGRVDPARGHGHDRDRADLRRPRAGRAPPRADRARGARRRPGRGRRGGVAARGGRGAAGGPAGALGAAAGGGAERGARPRRADRQAGALRGERRRGRRRRARRRGRARRGAATPAAVAISARLEAELSELDDDEAASMREELGIAESGLQRVVHGAFSLLDLIAFFTAGEDKPAQSWHLRRGPQRLARGGRDPLRHPARLRPRRGDRLGRAGRGGRLRAGARPRRAAARGPRLRDADGDVITVKFTP